MAGGDVEGNCDERRVVLASGLNAEVAVGDFVVADTVEDAVWVCDLGGVAVGVGVKVCRLSVVEDAEVCGTVVVLFVVSSKSTGDEDNSKGQSTMR